MSESNSEEMSGPEGQVGDGGSVVLPAGMSPYATGGGGVTFERKVAVEYLAHLLVGDGAVELGDGRHVVSVAFQQAPGHPVDDLVVRAARPDESHPSLVLALGIRRSPKIVESDESTRRLIRDFARAVINSLGEETEHRFGLIVAGPRQHAEQLAKLATHAVVQMDAPGFFELVRTPRTFDAGIRGRLTQLEKLVERALHDLGMADSDAALVEQRTWQLLSRLTVLMPRFEPPDDTDWSTVENSLIPVARGTDLLGASRLRDRLVVLAGEYSPTAARVDLTLLRRDAHEALNVAVRRHERGWQALDHLHKMALALVRDEITASDGASRVRLDRSVATADLVAAVEGAAAVVVTGESGVGKSSLALRSFAPAAADPDTVQALCLNLRHVPALTLAFEEALGCPLSSLLGELSARQRLLVVDGADAVAEGREHAFRYLADAARESDVNVVAVCAADTKQVVNDILAEGSGVAVREYVVPPLSDAEIDEVVGTFPEELSYLRANPRSRELLRRLVVVDLLVRGRVSGVPLTDADAMNEVWSGLVRRREVSDRGSPDARELALLLLAGLELDGGERLDVISSIDPAALKGLRRDGLLRRSVDDPFMVGPEFAHDEVRRYAVARLLLTYGDPASRILEAGAPRWSLAAARLAGQAWLARPDSAGAPLRGRFAALQASFDVLVEADHGARWGDVPGEALLTIADPGALLRDAWPELRADDSAGLRRLGRLVDQRLRDCSGIVNLAAVEPIITLLLEDDAPWRSGEYAQDLLREWLRAQVVSNTAAGHPLRILLRERLVGACAAADRRLAEEQDSEAAARAARTPEEVEEERRVMESQRALFAAISYGGPRRQRPEVPYEITDEIVLELLSLLGPDLCTDGEAILRRVAQDAPSRLAPAVEELFTGRALADYGRGLLAQLTEAYYLDDDAVGYDGFDDGIRRHDARSFGVIPQYAWYRGPFMTLFRTDFRNGVSVLNRLLNHAALVRARTLAHLDPMDALLEDEAVNSCEIELEITGARRPYVGDGQVWMWYRGTGVGPYPCFSALQALERACDELIENGIPIRNVVSILLDGCENLAMVGLIVGILVRHLEDADRLLDPYLAEPLIWECEFSRVVGEMSGLAASSEEIVAPERRNWSLREAAGLMVVRADYERAGELSALGATLVANERRYIESARYDEATDAAGGAEGTIEQELATVRAWASSLDSDRYEPHEASDGLYIRFAPPADVVEMMQHSNEDLQRAQEDARLFDRYHIKLQDGRADAVSAADLMEDIAAARQLLENPPSLQIHQPWDMPALVAAAALQAHILSLNPPFRGDPRVWWGLGGGGGGVGVLFAPRFRGIASGTPARVCVGVGGGVEFPCVRGCGGVWGAWGRRAAR